LTEKDKERLFEKFARLSAQPTAGEHSTGLGLSIVKRLVELMHGRVWCESESGTGATFIVRLLVSEEQLSANGISNRGTLEKLITSGSNVV
jgi:signal transduction histidine kinase